MELLSVHHVTLLLRLMLRGLITIPHHRNVSVAVLCLPRDEGYQGTLDFHVETREQFVLTLYNT